MSLLPEVCVWKTSKWRRPSSWSDVYQTLFYAEDNLSLSEVISAVDQQDLGCLVSVLPSPQKTRPKSLSAEAKTKTETDAKVIKNTWLYIKARHRNSANLTEPSRAERNEQLLVSLVFCLVVWFPSGHKAERMQQTTGWSEGTGPAGLHSAQKYFADSTNASSLCLSVY